MAVVYNFDDVLQGATLEKRVFGVKRRVNSVLQTLDGATVRFQVFRSKTSKLYIDKDNATNGGVTIVDADNCIIEIEEIKNVDLTPARYYWRLVVEYSDGDKKIYVGGKFRVVTVQDFADV